MEGRELDNREVLLSGFARLPERSVIFHKYGGAVEISMKVLRDTGEVLDIDSADFTALQINYLRSLLVGEEILTEEGILRIEQLLLRNFQSSLRKPVYSGIRACRQRLEELREEDNDRLIFRQE